MSLYARSCVTNVHITVEPKHTKKKTHGSHADKEISPGCIIEVSGPFGSVWCVLGVLSFGGLVIIG